MTSNRKFLILSSITNNKAELLDPSVRYDDCDYIAIVDRMYNTKIWKQVILTPFSCIDLQQHRRNAKIYKILSFLFFPQYEYIIWVDGTHNLKKSPQDIITEYEEFDLLVFKHPDRNCLFQEIETVKQRNLDTAEVLDEQKKYYTFMQMPQNYGLAEMTCFIKKNTPAVKQLEMMWWEHICRFSSRDQCSLTYCLWLLRQTKNINIKTFKGFANLYAGGNIYFEEHKV
jgi:hypothetical protein